MTRFYANTLRLIYTALFSAFLPLILARLFVRSFKSPQYGERWAERLALSFGGYETENGISAYPVIWIHAVSLGESEAAIPLINRLLAREDKPRLLITTTTPTGSERIIRAFGTNVMHVYLPYDIPWILNRFIQHFKPSCLVVMETEIWPNLYKLIGGKNKMPLIVANARLSEKSCRGYQKMHAFIAETLASVSCIAAQSEQDAERFVRLGASQSIVHVTGNIKFDLEFPDELINKGHALRREKLVAGSARSIWVAASTHSGEDELVLLAHKILLRDYPDLLLIIVPRHPERFDTVASMIEAHGLSLNRHSANDLIDGNCTSEVYLLDTMGELRTIYAAADIAFVGGSLVPIGGHNILEPAAVGLPIIFGPYMHNFLLISRLMLQAEAAYEVDSYQHLAERIKELLQNADKAESLGLNARKILSQNRGALDRLYKLIPKFSSVSK